MSRKGSLLGLRTQKGSSEQEPKAQKTKKTTGNNLNTTSRQGKKAMTGYFKPEMSFAMHITARKHGISLQDAMVEAFDDWLRKMGESPVGK